MISVIIPVYNAAQFVGECVESVLHQTYPDTEVILVNDGSRDDSLRVCRSYEASDPRVRVIDRENGGVSRARNAGLDVATGDYVVFVDADDLMMPQMLERLLGGFSGAETDMTLCGFTVQGAPNIYHDTDTLRENAGEILPEALLSLMIGFRQNRIRENVWRCLFRRGMLIENGIRFPEGVRIAEDFSFFIDAVHASRKIAIVPEDLYIYRFNTQSATAGYISCLPDDMTRLDARLSLLAEQYPALRVGCQERRALTYIRILQNMCLPGSPYSLRDAVAEARRVLRRGGYRAPLKVAYRHRRSLSKQDRVSVRLLRFGLVGSYLRLYAFYKKRQQKHVTQGK